MDSDRWRKLEDLYHQAMEHDPAERVNFLESACSGDESLLREVTSLIAEGEKTEGLSLASIAQSIAMDHNAEIDGFASQMIGREVAQYRIVKELGRGGMGEVYLALRADEHYQQQVALKVVRAGAESSTIVRRFKNERQILASLTHPNIARLLDGGVTEDGAPFFVMELIEGDSIDRYCDSKKLEVSDRLRLFLQVCSAVQYAHQRQIIHRDIKPSNILVTADGAAKLLDFGIAKMLEPGAVDGVTGPTQTIFRAFTPDYASPEQVSGKPVSAASDVYSLGILLYELLTGRRPYVFKTQHPSEITQIICDQEPEKPSAVVTRNPADPTPQTSDTKTPDRKRLSSQLVGDLDAITLMALRKEPERRYTSVAEMAEDIRRHLDGLPIHARPSTVTYRASKFLNRHSELVLATVVFVLTLLGLSVWQAKRTTVVQTRKPAPVPAITPRKSVAILGLANLSGRSDAAWPSTAVAEMLNSELAAGEKLRVVSGEDVERAKTDLSLRKAERFSEQDLAHLSKNLASDFVVTGSYLDLGKKQNGAIHLDLQLHDTAQQATIANLSENGREAQLLDLVGRAGTQLRSKLEIDPLSASQAASVGASLPANLEAMRFYSEGLTKSRGFDFVGARVLFTKAVAADPRFALGRSALASSWSSLGYDKKALAESKQAFDLSGGLDREDRMLIEAHYRSINNENEKTLEIYKSLATLFPDNFEYGLGLAEAQRDVSKSKDAEATLATLRKLPAPQGNDPRIDLYEAQVQDDLSNAPQAQAAAEKAISMATQLGERQIVARAKFVAGQVFYASSGIQLALPALEDARAIYASVGDKFSLCETESDIAQLYYLQDDSAHAKPYLQHSLATAREIGSQNALMLGLNVMGNILRAEGDLKQAEADYRESDRIAVDTDEEPGRLSPLDGLGWTEFNLGNLAEAEKAFALNLAINQKRGSGARAGLPLTGIGKVALARGDLTGAGKHYEDALKAYEAGGSKYRIAKQQVLMAWLSIEQGKLDEADQLLTHADEEFRKENSNYGRVLAETAQIQLRLNQKKYADAQREAQDIADLVPKANSIDASFDFANVKAQSDAAVGRVAQAEKELRSAIEEIKRHGFVPQEFEARLALARLELNSGRVAAGRSQLANLQRDARARSFLLVAHKAAAML